jgi:hypothetical protein
MVAIQSLFVSLIAATAIANPTLRTRDEHKKCLSEHEAEKFATVWLRFWSTGGVKTKADLTPYVTKNIVNADYAFGPPNVGIDALFAATTYVDPLITAVVQTPLDVFNTCDKIAVRWGYTAKSTGVNSYVFYFILNTSFLGAFIDYLAEPSLLARIFQCMAWRC